MITVLCSGVVCANILPRFSDAIKMRRGNLSRDRSTFSWRAEGGVRKTHRLGKNDLFVQVSMTGEDFIVQRKGKPQQFLVINSDHLERYLRKYRDAAVYMTFDAFERLPHSLGELEDAMHIVYPTNTRSTARRDAGSAAGASSTAPHAAEASANVHEIDDDDEDVPSNAPPKGLYVWMQDNEVLLFNLLCDAQKLNDYLRQAVPGTCTKVQYDSLMQGQGCGKDEQISRCVRRLLSRVHPDKLSPDLRACGETLYKNISEAYSELKQRPNFEPSRTCV